MTGPRRHRSPPGRRAFTLVEVLVAVGVIALLVGLLAPAIGASRASADRVRDLAVARQLMVGYTSHAVDHAEMVLYGFLRNDPATGGPITARDHSGRTLRGLSAQRYPWRLLPWLDGRPDVLYRDLHDFEEAMRLAPDDFAYQFSVAPSFGLNQGFVGGSSDADGTPSVEHPATAALYGSSWYVRRLSDPARPSSLMVFATSYGQAARYGRLRLPGHYRITPPSVGRRLWQDRPADADTPSGLVGNVDLRHAGKAVGAMFDGHAAALGWDELQDMRRWAPTADRPDWTLEPHR